MKTKPPADSATQGEVRYRPTYTVEQVRDELRKFVPPFRWVLIERLITAVKVSGQAELADAKAEIERLTNELYEKVWELR